MKDEKHLWLPKLAAAALCIPLPPSPCSRPSLCDLHFLRNKRPNHQLTQQFYIKTSYHDWDPLWGQNSVLVPLAAFATPYIEPYSDQQNIC